MCRICGERIFKAMRADRTWHWLHEHGARYIAWGLDYHIPEPVEGSVV